MTNRIIKHLAYISVLLHFCMNALFAQEAIKIMPVGNSITAGEHYGAPPVPERTGYRKDLYEMLIEDGYNIDFVGLKEHGQRAESDTNWYDWNSESYPGWGIVDIGRMATAALDVCKPDIILAHVGTNGTDWDQKPGQVMDMLDKFNKYSFDNDHPMTVFLCKIVKRFIEEDSGPTSQFNIDVADSVAKRTGDKIKIIIVDMENGAGLDYTDAPPDPTANPPYEGGDYWGRTYPTVPYDKYHPNDKGNTKMAVKFYEELVKELDPPETMENNMVTGIELTATADSTIKITWAANFLDEDGYNIERAETGSGFSIVGTANANTRYFLDSSADAEKEYKYRIKAFNNAGGESLYSSEVSYIPVYYTLTTSVEGQGDVNVSPSSDSYLAGVGTIVTLTATPAQGWKFTKWSGDITAFIYSNPTTVVMNSDLSITANFKQLTDVDEDVSNGPKEFALHQNYPNPFNPSTTISFQLQKNCYTTLKIYDLSGREAAVLVNGIQPAGIHKLEFNASGLSSGVYLIRLQAELYNKTIKILLTK